MKKILVYLCVALPMIFTACEKNDGGNDTINTIVGTWGNTGSLPKEVSVTGNDNLKMKIVDELTATYGNGHTFTFHENGNVTLDGENYATYTLNGKTILFSGTHSYSSEFSVVSDILTIYDDVTKDYADAYPNDVINKVIVARMYAKK